MTPIGNVKSVHVVFGNGDEVDGFVSEWRGKMGNVANVTVCKHNAARGEDPHVALDFDRIAKVEIR